MCWYLVAQWSLIIQIFHRVKRTQDHQTNISYGSNPAFWDKTINLISRHLNLFTAIHKAVTTSTDQVHTEHTESFSWFLLLKFRYSDLPNNCAVNLIIFREKNTYTTLLGPIDYCTKKETKVSQKILLMESSKNYFIF